MFHILMFKIEEVVVNWKKAMDSIAIHNCYVGGERLLKNGSLMRDVMWSVSHKVQRR